MTVRGAVLVLPGADDLEDLVRLARGHLELCGEKRGGAVEPRRPTLYRGEQKVHGRESRWRTVRQLHGPEALEVALGVEALLLEALLEEGREGEGP